MPENRKQQLILFVRELRALYRHLYNTRPGDQPATKGAALTRSQNELLSVVAKCDGGITTTHLAKELHVSNGAVTQTVDGLVSKGLLSRQENPSDRRSTLICLDRPLQPASFEEFYVDHISPLFADLSDTEIRQLIALLEKIKKEQS